MLRNSRRRFETLRRNRRLFLGCEQLENRQLMAIVTSVSLGVLTMTGDGANDLAIIQSNTPGSVDVQDFTTLSAITYSGINQIIFNGNGGDDELRIIQNNVTGPTTNNIFIPSGGIQFNGGADNDLLTMAGGTVATFGAGMYTPGVAGAGEVRYDILTSVTDVDVDFTGVEQVNDTTTAGAFAAVQGGGNDTMVIEPGPNLLPVGGVKQGPVFLDGGDRDDVGHGSASGGVNLNGWKFIEQAMDFVVNNAINSAPANTLLVIGANGGQALAAANSAATHAGGPGGHIVTHINALTGPNSIATVDFNQYRAIYIPSSQFSATQNVVGGITDAQIAALAARTADIGAFVLNGGGIAALTEEDSVGPFSFLQLPLPFTIAPSGNNTMIQTPALAAAGFNITNAELTAGTPVHNEWTGPVGFNGLDVLVVNAINEIIVIGQGAINTQIGGGATLRISGSLTTMNVGRKTSLLGNTGLGNDSLTLDGSVTSLDAIGIPVTLDAAGGTDSVTITDAADPSGDTVAISTTQVTGLAMSAISFAGAETLTVGTTQGNDAINVDFTPANLTANVIVNAFAGDDTFGTLPATRIKPSLTTTLTLNGGTPVVLPGDRLNLDMALTTGPVFVDTVGGQALSQSHRPVYFSSIETYDVIDDSGPILNVDQGDLYVRGTPGSDLITFAKGSGVTTRVRVNGQIYSFSPNNQIIAYGRDMDDNIAASNITLPVDFRGENGNDYLTGGVANDWLTGGLGNDRINGSNGNNIIWGDNSPLPADPTPQDSNLGGNDNLSALGGSDVFYGGNGNDIVSAGPGNDYLNGNLGDDILSGNEGDDRIYGGAGNDNLSGHTGHDLISAGAGNDLVYGAEGNDVLFGGVDVDLIDAGAGQDLIVSGMVANESSSWTSQANTGTFPSSNYVSGSDQDGALLALLSLWVSTGDIVAVNATIGSITHDDVSDVLFGGVGNDAFCWESEDVDPGLSPPDYGLIGMGMDQRFGPNA